MNRQVSARGGRRRPKLEREPNGMAVVAQIPKSVNTNRQEVRHARWDSVFSSRSTSSAQGVNTALGTADGREPGNWVTENEQ